MAWYFMCTVFTRVMLCVSAVFAVVRCLSVRPCVTLVDCIHTAEGVVKVLVQPGSAITVVFLTSSAGTQFQAEPLQWGAQDTWGWENFAIFD